METSWRDIRTEYERVRIGPLIKAEIVAVTKAVASRYDPRIYADTASWEHSLDDLVDDVALVLLKPDANGDQLAWIMDQAASTKELRRLVRRHVKRTLQRRRRRTVKDNLLDRCGELLREPPFVCVSPATNRFAEVFALPSFTEIRQLMADELRRAQLRVSAVPRRMPGRGERAPMVYETDALRTVLIAIAESFEHAFTLRDVDAVLEVVLSSWLPSELEEEMLPDRVNTAIPSPADQTLGADTARRLLASLDDDLKTALLLLGSGMTVTTVAQETGTSRVTVTARRKKIRKRIRDMEEGLPPAARRHMWWCLRLLLEGEEST